MKVSYEEALKYCLELDALRKDLSKHLEQLHAWRKEQEAQLREAERKAGMARGVEPRRS